MKVDFSLPLDLRGAPHHVRDAEAVGFDGIFTAETNHDPFLPLAVASHHTERAELGTCIAVAFARNPMNVAYLAHDLHAATSGRFVLGLGSQIKAHVTKRFGMPWSRPAARMREFVAALRAIWDAWDGEAPLRFRGEFYTHLLMTPFFAPEPNTFGHPKVFVAGVGERMTEVAGEVADGFFAHTFTTERYLREVTVPALKRGRDRSTGALDEVEIAMPLLIVTGHDDAEHAAAAARARQQIAFYASTPAYLAVLEHHGWGALHTELHRMTRQAQWDAMSNAIDDEILATFAIVAEPEQVAAAVRHRFGDLLHRVSFALPLPGPLDAWRSTIDDLHAI